MNKKTHFGLGIFCVIGAICSLITIISTGSILWFSMFLFNIVGIVINFGNYSDTLEEEKETVVELEKPLW
jgi:hypothetical protein